MKDFNQKDPMDPKLEQLLNLLRETPERDPERVEKNRKKYLIELESLPLPDQKPSIFKRFLWSLGVAPAQQKKEYINMVPNRKRIAITIAAVLVVAVIFLFGGSTITVMAAQNAIPGDTLYPLKTTFENTRLSLTSDASSKVELHLQYAEERLAEIDSLISEGRLTRIEPAVVAFENHIKSALEEVQKVAMSDTATAIELMDRIMDSLSRYAGTLSRIAEYIPESLLDEVMAIIEDQGGMNTNDNSNLNVNEDYYDNMNDNMIDNDNLSPSFNDNSDPLYNENDSESYNYNGSESYNYNDSPSYDDNDDSSSYNDNFNSNSNDND